MFDIMKGVNTEALITNSFFKNNQEVIINNALDIWEYTGFQEVLPKWNYSNLTINEQIWILYKLYNIKAVSSSSTERFFVDHAQIRAEEYVQLYKIPTYIIILIYALFEFAHLQNLI